MSTQQLDFSLHVIPCPGIDHLIVVFQLTHISHIQDVHNIAGPSEPYDNARPKRGLITEIERSVIRPLLYLQATTAGLQLSNYCQKDIRVS